MAAVEAVRGVTGSEKECCSGTSSVSAEEEKPGFVVLTYDVPSHTPSSYLLHIPESMFWPAYETINKIGVSETFQLLEFAGVLSGLLKEANVPNTSEAFKALWERFGDPSSTGGSSGRTSMEAALDITYTLLHKDEIGWKRAASIASLILGKQVRDDAWRKRMKRWAKDTGRNPIRIYNREKEGEMDV